MASYIRTLDHRQIETVFWLIFFLTFLVAVFPPLYLSASGAQGMILGIPLSFAYWILDPLVLMIAMTVYYAIEHIRGDLDNDIEDMAADAAPGGEILTVGTA